MSRVGLEKLEAPSKSRTDSFLMKLSATVHELYKRCEQNHSDIECNQILELLNASIKRFEEMKRSFHRVHKDDSESNSLHIITNFDKKVAKQMQNEDRENPSDLETVIGSTPVSAPSELSDANVTNSVIGDDALTMFSPTNMSQSATNEGSKSWADYDSEGEIDFSTNAGSHAQKKLTGHGERDLSDNMRKRPWCNEMEKPCLSEQLYPTVASTPFGQVQVVENFQYYSAPNLPYSVPNQYYPSAVVYPYFPTNSTATQTPFPCVGSNVYSVYPPQLPYPPVLNVYPQSNGLPYLGNARSAPNILTEANSIDGKSAKKGTNSLNNKH